MPRVMLEQGSDVRLAHEKFDQIFNDHDRCDEDAMRACHLTIDQFNILLRIAGRDVQLASVTKTDGRLVPTFVPYRGEPDAS